MREVYYSELESFFDECSIWDSPFEGYFYEQTWNFLRKNGLCKYSNDEEECNVYLRALAIVVLYYDFCYRNYDDADFVGYTSYHYLARGILSATTIGMLSQKYFPNQTDLFAHVDTLTYKLAKEKIPDIISSLRQNMNDTDIITWLYCARYLLDFTSDDGNVMNYAINDLDNYVWFHSCEADTLKFKLKRRYDYSESSAWLNSLTDSPKNKSIPKKELTDTTFSKYRDDYPFARTIDEAVLQEFDMAEECDKKCRDFMNRTMQEAHKTLFVGGLIGIVLIVIGAVILYNTGDPYFVIIASLLFSCLLVVTPMQYSKRVTNNRIKNESEAFRDIQKYLFRQLIDRQYSDIYTALGVPYGTKISKDGTPINNKGLVIPEPFFYYCPILLHFEQAYQLDFTWTKDPAEPFTSIIINEVDHPKLNNYTQGNEPHKKAFTIVTAATTAYILANIIMLIIDLITMTDLSDTLMLLWLPLPFICIAYLFIFHGARNDWSCEINDKTSYFYSKSHVEYSPFMGERTRGSNIHLPITEICMVILAILLVLFTFSSIL